MRPVQCKTVRPIEMINSMFNIEFDIFFLNLLTSYMTFGRQTSASRVRVGCAGYRKAIIMLSQNYYL